MNNINRSFKRCMYNVLGLDFFESAHINKKNEQTITMLLRTMYYSGYIQGIRDNCTDKEKMKKLLKEVQNG